MRRRIVTVLAAAALLGMPVAASAQAPPPPPTEGGPTLDPSTGAPAPEPTPVPTAPAPVTPAPATPTPVAPVPAAPVLSTRCSTTKGTRVCRYYRDGRWVRTCVRRRGHRRHCYLAHHSASARAVYSPTWQAVGYTRTSCLTATGTQGPVYTSSHGFTATTIVQQDLVGEWTAVRGAVWDARGWRISGWAMSNVDQSTQRFGGFEPGVAYNWTFDDLIGHQAYMWVQYAWYTSQGWAIGAEYLTDYQDQYGLHSRYCQV